jgi:hypothetical protein
MTTTPSWLETAAKLDALAGDRVPPPAARDAGELGQSDAGAALREDEAPAEPVVQAARQEPRFPEIAEAKPRSRIGEQPARTIPAATGEEVELAWHGYSAAALIPSTIALAAFTASALVLLRPLVPTWVVHEAADAPLAALWMLQAVRAGYRLVAYSYRLTTKRLLRSRGRLYPADEPLELATVGRAVVSQTLLGKLFEFGTVRVFREDGTAAAEFPGVRRPKVLASQIEEAVTAARQANVTAGRLWQSNR